MKRYKNEYKRTNLKVEVCNGMQYFTRTVYEDEFGKHFFKHRGERCYIYARSNGKGYNAPWFNGVEYISADA